MGVNDGGLKSVKDLLEMKDTSELMVSLAYSALLYNNKSIANEVLLLEERMDELYERVKREAIEESVEDGNVDRALVLLQLAESAEVIADAALEIVDVVLRDIEPHPVLKMSLMDSDTVITSGQVSVDSDLANKKIGEAKVASETGMWIIAIRRGSRWIYGPDENTLVLPGDVLIAEGPYEAIERFKNILAGKEHI